MSAQYRSIILYHSEQQRAIAEQSKRDTDASGLWPNPIVTEISPFTTFYKAEDYHQNFYRDNPYQPYCLAIIDPKISKLRKRVAGEAQKYLPGEVARLARVSRPRLILSWFPLAWGEGARGCFS